MPSTNPFEEDTSGAEESSEQGGRSQHPFCGIIGQCFEPHLPIYVESLDRYVAPICIYYFSVKTKWAFIHRQHSYLFSFSRNLADMMERFIADSKQQFASLDAATMEASVLPSCADLFVFYKKCLVQCSQLSTSTTMLALSQTFQKYLREYGIKVLQGNLPK